MFRLFDKTSFMGLVNKISQLLLKSAGSWAVERGLSNASLNAPAAADENVVSGAADQDVVAQTARDRVRAVVAEQADGRGEGRAVVRAGGPRLPGSPVGGRGDEADLERAVAGRSGEEGAGRSEGQGGGRGLAQEFAAQNINVNCVAPGPVNTERSTPLTFDMKQIPSGRFAEISEVTALIRLLCGAQGRYITGQTIHVNGGFYMNN